MNYAQNMNNCLLYFKKWVGQVEVKNEDEKLTKCYFQIPFECVHMTNYIEQHVMPKSEDSVQQRITRFNSYIDRYTVAILSRQKLARNKILFFFIKEWRTMKNISFGLVCIINILHLVFLVRR